MTSIQLLAACTLLTTGLGVSSVAPNEIDPGAPVVLEFPEADPSWRSVLVPAVATPHREAVVSSNSDARLAEIVVEPGQRVRKGDVIAHLDNAVLQAAADSARAAAERESGIARARQALELAKLTYDRTLSAHRDNAAHDSELDQARVSFLLAEAELTQAIESKQIAELDHDLALARLEERVIRAPFDGRIVRIDSEVGTVLNSGDPIATVADFSNLTVFLDLPSSWYDKLDVGSRYSLAAEDRMWGTPAAELVFIEPRINPATSTMRCEFVIENSTHTRPSGFTVVPVTENGLAWGASLEPGGVRDQTTRFAGFDPTGG